MLQYGGKQLPCLLRGGRCTACFLNIERCAPQLVGAWCITLRVGHASGVNIDGCDQHKFITGQCQGSRGMQRAFCLRPLPSRDIQLREGACRLPWSNRLTVGCGKTA